MINAIFISEYNPDGICRCNLYDYDKIPKQVRRNVDIALIKSDKSLKCDIYSEGMQYIMFYEKQNNVDFTIINNTIVNYMGKITLYDENYEQYNN